MPPTGDPLRIAQAVAAKLKQNISAIAAEHPLWMSLTAGQDSRMLAAAATAADADVKYFTMRSPNKSARIDCRVAEVLARRHRLSHTIFDWEEPRKDQLDDWQFRVGDCVAGATWRAVETFRQLDADRAFMPGLCGEVGRGFYWRAADLEDDSPVEADELVDRMRHPQHPSVMTAATKWLSGLEGLNRRDLLDFAYIEQRLGCWAGPSHYGHTKNLRIIPLSDREIFSNMFRLPPRHRFKSLLPRAVIKELSPEMLSIAFNNDVGLRRALLFCKKAALAVKIKLFG